jgi:hypothetical protein
MTAAMRYAVLASLLALSTATSSFAQNRAIHDDDPFRYCLPTTVDSSDEQKVYCEGWRAFRRGWSALICSCKMDGRRKNGSVTPLFS